MPRVRTLEMDGLSFKISPMSFDEAEAYIAEGRELVKRDPPPALEEWAKRTLESVVVALNKSKANGDWDVTKVRKELDIPLVNRIYEEFMDISGLGLPKSGEKGEARAASTSN